MVVDVLPRCERLLYWIGGVGSMLYTLYSFYRHCQEKKDYLDLKPGMKLLGGEKDAPDIEWSSFCRQIPVLVPFLVGHVILGHLLHYVYPNVWLQKTARLVYDVLAITYMFGTRSTLLCVAEASIVYLVTLQGRQIFVWVAVVTFMFSSTSDWFLKRQLRLVQPNEDKIPEFFISLAYLHIRLISAGVEMIKHKNVLMSYTPKLTASQRCQEKRPDSKPDSSSDIPRKISVIDFVAYIFYLPVYFTGPTLSFDTYLSQLFILNPSHSHRYDLKEIIKRMGKIVMIAIFIEFQSHFLYMGSAQAYSFIKSMPTQALIGMGWWQGTFFYLKYVCLFGISQVFYAMDGISPIPLPACPGYIYSYTEMWKVFDVGYYRFVKNYIYIPLGGSQAGFGRQILATVLAFSFVCNWHGGDSSIFVWCGGNLIVILMEITGGCFERSASGLKLKAIVGAANIVRFKGLLASPLLLASVLQDTYFFFYYEAGNVMVQKIILNVTWKTLFLEYAGFYCAIQNAMLIHRWINERKLKSKDN